MYVKAIIILCAVIILVIIYLFFRGSSNRSRVQSDREIVDGIRDSVEKSRNSINRTKSDLDKLSINSESAIKRTDDIKQNNDNARTGIKSALEILREAKNRDNT